MKATDDNARLGRNIKALSASVETPVYQADELTGLLARVAETEGIPEPLVLALSRVLEHLYEADHEAGDGALLED